MNQNEIDTMKPQELIVLPPAERASVALKSQAAEAHLRELVAKSAEITNVVDKNGRDEAHRAAMGLKNARVNVSNAGEDVREDAVAFQKAVVAEVKRLAAITADEEKRLLALRDAFDAKMAAEKAERERIEAERVAAIRAKIDAIAAIPGTHAAAGSAELNAALSDLALRQVTPEEFAELAAEASQAIDSAAAALLSMREAARARELAEAERARLAKIEQEKIEADRAELARLKAEQAEREAKAKAEAAERERVAQQERAAAAERERKQAEEMEALRQQLAAMTAAAQAAAPAPAEPAPSAMIAAIEEDHTGLIVGQVVLNSDTIPTGDLGVPAIVEASPATLRDLAAASRAAMRSVPRPEFGEIVEVLATHYGVSEETIIGWLKTYAR